MSLDDGGSDDVDSESLGEIEGAFQKLPRLRFPCQDVPSPEAINFVGPWSMIGPLPPHMAGLSDIR